MDPERPLPSDPSPVSGSPHRGEIGRYRVVRLLGQGAMGRVLLAHDPVLERSVAVKLLRDDLGLPAEQRRALLERMRQEARASARVSHPHIVALHDMGDHPELGLFLVFEYAEGQTMKDRLERGPLPPEVVARLARPVGEALTTAHDAGVLHRDIKPENIILTKAGPKVADFGIARVPDSTLTRDGGLLGTPAYSAPEALTDGAFSPLSDQFSMAATFWEALSGRRAFPGDDAVAVASRITNDEPPHIAAVCGLDPHVDTVLARGLSKHPRARYETCAAFGDALAAALETGPRGSLATVPDQVHRQMATRQQETRVVRIAVGAAAIGALFVVGLYQLRRELTPTVRPLPPVPLDVGSASAQPRPIGYLAENPARPRPTRASAVIESTAPSASSSSGSDADAGVPEEPPAPAASAPDGVTDVEP